MEVVFTMTKSKNVELKNHGCRVQLNLLNPTSNDPGDPRSLTAGGRLRQVHMAVSGELCYQNRKNKANYGIFRNCLLPRRLCF